VTRAGNSWAKTAAGFSFGTTRTKKTAFPLSPIVVAASALYSARRKVLRAIALRASDLGATAALRSGPGPATNLTCKCAERAERPAFMTCSTSWDPNRRRFFSIAQEVKRGYTDFLYRFAGAALARAAQKSSAAARRSFAAQKSVRTGAFALFWLVGL
jgi:hypothetical protein